MKTENKKNPSFDEIVTAYNGVCNGKTEDTDGKILFSLSCACSFSVLKKIHEKTGNLYIAKMKNALYNDIQRLPNDKNLVPFSDAFELPQECSLAILSEVEKQREREPLEQIDLLRPYETRELSKKVWIKSEESNAFRTVKKSPIQRIFTALRSYIYSLGNVSIDPSNGFVYLEDYITTEDNDGETYEIYRRLGRYMDLGGHVTDFNGQETVTATATAATYEEIQGYREKMNLSDRQDTVLDLRLRGYGSKAIATYIGCDVKTVKRNREQIKTKLLHIGFDPEKVSIQSIEKHILPNLNPSRKTKIRHFYPVKYTVKKNPVVTCPSAFGKVMDNNVVDGRLVGSNGKTVDSWL